MAAFKKGDRVIYTGQHCDPSGRQLFLDDHRVGQVGTVDNTDVWDNIRVIWDNEKEIGSIGHYPDNLELITGKFYGTGWGGYDWRSAGVVDADAVAQWGSAGFGSVKELQDIMAETPAWAHGLPVKAEGWTGHRYAK